VPKTPQIPQNVRWSCPLILHQLRGSSRALLKRSLRAASLYPNPSAAPTELHGKLPHVIALLTAEAQGLELEDASV